MATHFYSAANCDPLGQKGFRSVTLSLGRRSASVSQQFAVLQTGSAGGQAAASVAGDAAALRKPIKPS
jgi:hypothetical protein